MWTNLHSSSYLLLKGANDKTILRSRLATHQQLPCSRLYDFHIKTATAFVHSVVQISVLHASKIPMTLQMKSMWSVAGSMSYSNLPGTAGEHSSPAFHKSIPKCSKRIGRSFFHKTVGYTPLCAGVQPEVRDLKGVSKLSLFFCVYLSQFTRKKRCVLLCEKAVRLRREKKKISLLYPVWECLALRPLPLWEATCSTGVWLPMLTSL